MRIVCLAVALLAASPAAAASIEGTTALACSDLEDQKKIDRAAAAGDTDGVAVILKRLLASGRCGVLKEGTRIRVESNSFPYACVVRFGTGEDCVWVRQRHVDVRN